MSRNQREGRFAGRAWGKAARSHTMLPRVRAAKARVIILRRNVRRLGRSIKHITDQPTMGGDTWRLE